MMLIVMVRLGVPSYFTLTPLKYYFRATETARASVI